MEYKDFVKSVDKEFPWLWAVMGGNWGLMDHLHIDVRRANAIHPQSILGKLLTETDTEVWLAFGSPMSLGQRPRVFQVQQLILKEDKDLRDNIRLSDYPGIDLLYIITKQMAGKEHFHYAYWSKTLTVFKPPSFHGRSFNYLYLG